MFVLNEQDGINEQRAKHENGSASNSGYIWNLKMVEDVITGKGKKAEACDGEKSLPGTHGEEKTQSMKHKASHQHDLNIPAFTVQRMAVRAFN